MQQTGKWLKENRYIRVEDGEDVYFWRAGKNGTEGYLAKPLDLEWFDLKPVGRRELEKALEERYGEIALV